MVLFFYFLSRYLFSQFSAAKRLHCFFKFYIMNYTTKKKSDSRFTAFPLLKSCQPTLVNDTNGAFPLMKQELTKPSSLRAISMLAVFTFLFLSTEYFYVNQIAQNASSARTVNVQNYALGISAVGFCLYPLLFRFFRDRLHSAVFFTLTMLAIVCFVILGSPVPPGLLTAVGMLLFLVLGILGSAVHYHFLCEISDKKYFARMVGISYGFAILLQFLNNSLISSALAEQLLLCAALLFIVFFLFRFQHREASRSSQMPDTANSSPQVSDVTNPCPHMSDTSVCAASGSTDSQHKLPAPSASGALPQLVLLIFLVIFMTCIFSTLDNTVTLGHADGTMDIGQWPRILLACSGLAAGFLFDLHNRRFMNLIMYCIMMLSTLSVAILQLGGSFLIGLIVFYLSSGFFVVFFTTSFLALSEDTRCPRLWAGMGRAVNNAGAALVSNLSLSLIASNSSITLIITALILFATVSILIAAYSMLNAPGVQTETGGTMTHKMQAACEAKASHNTKAALGNDSSASTASDISSDPDYPQNTPNADPFSTFSTTFSLTDREQSVFDQLVNTEKSIQEIADSLFISRRTCQRYITSIYEKVGAKSRMGLYQSYIEWQRKNL